MTSVTVNITRRGDFRATEIVADLRNASEILYYPMTCVGFWDVPTGGHICPQLQRGTECPHRDQALETYRDTVENHLRGVIEVEYPHAGVYIYLG